MKTISAQTPVFTQNPFPHRRARHCVLCRQYAPAAEAKRPLYLLQREKVARNARRMRCYSKISTVFPSAHNLPLQGDHALFSLHKRKKFQKRSVRACRSTAPTHRLPSKKIPTSPHARTFGSNGVPQKDYGFPHSQIFPHRVRRTNRYFIFLRKFAKSSSNTSSTILQAK